MIFIVVNELAENTVSASDGVNRRDILASGVLVALTKVLAVSDDVIFTILAKNATDTATTSTRVGKK